MTQLLIKASLVIMVMWTFYKLFLEGESFFKSNRIYLLSCLALACALPFITLPQLVKHQGAVDAIFESQVPVQSTEFHEQQVATEPFTAVIDDPFDDVSEMKEVELNTLEAEQSTTSTKSKKARPLSFWLLLIYGFGVAVFAINLLIQIVNTLRLARKNPDKIEEGESIIVNMQGDVAPCSFFRYIFINPASYDYETYEQIIAHEQIHVRMKHSFDLLLSELAVVLLWFNPFVWFLRKEVEKNIEYQTDDVLVNDSSEEKQSYQLNLVKIASGMKPLRVTTNYNQSLIKQRILKMNNKRSNNSSYWKYAFVVPMVFLLLVFLNQPYTATAQPDSGLENQLTEESPVSRQQPIANPSGDSEPPQEAAGPATAGTSPVVALTSQSQDSPCLQLLEAIRKQDVALVTELLKTTDASCMEDNPGYDQMVYKNGTSLIQRPRTPMQGAARVGSVEIAKLLVAAGAEAGPRDRGEGTPLLMAANYGHLDFVKYLETQGVDLKEKSPNQGSALIAAASNGRTEVVQYLLGIGMEVDYLSRNRGTALIAAAGHGALETVKVLVDAGADVTAYSSNRANALISAASSGHPETVEYLLEQGAELDFMSSNRGNALIAAASNGNTETVRLLLAKGADISSLSSNRGTPLIAAASNGHSETLALLIDKGADLAFMSSNRGNALIAAASNGHAEAMELLIEKGADINESSSNRGTALIAAANNGHAEAIELLLSEQVDINQQSSNRGNALIAAANNGHTEVIALLMDKGGDLNRVSSNRGTPLLAAANNGHTETVRYLLSEGASINYDHQNRGTALMIAANNGHTNTMKLLIEEGADVNYNSPNRGTALMSAADNGHLEAVKLLLAEGADVNHRSANRGTALMAAADNGHYYTVEYLVNKGADVNTRNRNRTALDKANENGHSRVARYLKSKGGD